MIKKAFQDYALNNERYTQIINTLLAAGFTHVDMTIYTGSIQISIYAHSQEEKLLGEGIFNGFIKKGEHFTSTEANTNGETFWIIEFIHHFD